MNGLYFELEITKPVCKSQQEFDISFQNRSRPDAVSQLHWVGAGFTRVKESLRLSQPSRLGLPKYVSLIANYDTVSGVEGIGDAR
jgi:hypothetical protein